MQTNIPQSIEGEAAVLGSMMLEPEQIPLAEDEVRAEMFFQPANQIVFTGILNTYAKWGVKFDIILLRATLKGKLRQIGGVAYLVKIAEAVPSASNMEYYIDIVKDKWRERELLKFGTETLRTVQEEITTEEKYIKTSKHLNDILAKNMHVKTSNVRETIRAVNFDLEGSYIKTGFNNLDEYIYGLGKGDMITIAGRPSMGKTALMIDIAMNLTQLIDDKAVAIFSLEMSAEKIQQRMICILAKINIKNALHGYLTAEDKDILDDCKEVLSNHCNILIDTTAGMTPSQLKAKILRMDLIHGLSAVFVDRIGLMRTDGSGHKKKWEQVTEISNMIKTTAMQLNIPIIILCQLGRQVEDRNDKTPKLSDLRHSGAIEEDSNVVLLLYRPGYYDKGKGDGAEIIVAKNTQGETGSVNMIFVDSYAHFEERAEDNFDKI